MDPFEILARDGFCDRESLDDLAPLCAAAQSVDMQRAVAQFFIRSDCEALIKPAIVRMLKQSL